MAELANQLLAFARAGTKTAAPALERVPLRPLVDRVVAREGQDRVAITIADRGPGVPPDALDRLFDPFYRPASFTRERNHRVDACGAQQAQGCRTYLNSMVPLTNSCR